jgi:DNA repair exonuclease SbcCD ATPase subunit
MSLLRLPCLASRGRGVKKKKGNKEMKLHKLNLKNFLNHREVELELGHINIFSGENGTGKSAIREAVLFALTGITRRNPVNFGAKSCEVKIDNGDWQIYRKETSSGSKSLHVANGNGSLEGSNSEIQQAFLNEIGLTLAQVDSMLNTGRFLAMEEAERKKVIFKALGIEISKENLTAWLSKQDKETDWEKIVTTFDSKEFNFNDDNQKIFIERRRASKREREGLEERKRRFSDLPAPDVKKCTEAKKLLWKLNELLTGLYEQRGQQKAVVQLKVELEAVKAELNKPDNSDKIRRHEDDLKEAEQKLEETRTGKEPLLSEKASLEAELKTLQSFEEVGGTCDRCGQKVSKEVAKKLSNDNKKRITEAGKWLKDINKKLDDNIKSIADYHKSINDIKLNIDELRKTHYHGDRKSLEKRYDELLTLINESSATEGLEEEIQTLEARINKGQQLVNDLNAAEAADKERASLEEEIALAEQQIKQYDSLEKAYSPKGVKAELLREKLGGFQASVNDMLQAVNLGKLEITTEKNGKEVFEISINGLPEFAYSRAQRWAIAIALQGALSSNGLKILCIDDADMFVGSMKSLANKMIIANKNRFDSILIFRATDQRPAANGTDIKNFWLHGRGVEAV